MKKSIFITVALFAFTTITNQLFAQEASLKTSGKTMGIDDWQQTNAKVAQGQHIKKATLLVCRVTPTDDGCVVTLENNIVSPRDAASGLPTGKRMKPLSVFVSASDNAVSEVKSPRDAASGLATGKRMHKPSVITKELDKSSPELSETVAKGREASAPSVSEIVVTKSVDNAKVSMQDFHFTSTCGGKTTQIDCVDGRCEIPIGECPDGTCTAIASWSWGATNTGSSGMGGGSGSGRCSVDFLLEIEDGACTAMAINEKGLPGEKGPAKKVK